MDAAEPGSGDRADGDRAAGDRGAERSRYRAADPATRPLDPRHADRLGDVVDAAAAGDRGPAGRLARHLSGTVRDADGRSVFYVHFNRESGDRDRVTISGNIYRDWDHAGQIERTFRRDPTGLLVVENGFLALAPPHRGRGFASAFAPKLEAYYRASGVDVITVHAGLDNGGYTWARQRFTWDRGKLAGSLDSMQQQITELLAGRKRWPLTAAEAEAGQSLGAPIVLTDEDRVILRRLQGELTLDSQTVPLPGVLSELAGSDGDLGRKLLVKSHWDGMKALTERGDSYGSAGPDSA